MYKLPSLVILIDFWEAAHRPVGYLKLNNVLPNDINILTHLDFIKTDGNALADTQPLWVKITDKIYKMKRNNT